METIVIF